MTVVSRQAGGGFTSTDHCRQEVHCDRCRALEDGRAWRGSMVRAFGPGENGTSGGGVDFECPLGKPWTFTSLSVNRTPTGPPGWPDGVDADVQAVCESCRFFRMTPHGFPHCLAIGGCVRRHVLLNVARKRACPIGRHTL